MIATIFNMAPTDVALVVAGLIRESEQNSEAGQRKRAGELAEYIARRQNETHPPGHPGFACTCAKCAAQRRRW